MKKSREMEKSREMKIPGKGKFPGMKKSRGFSVMGETKSVFHLSQRRKQYYYFHIYNFPNIAIVKLDFYYWPLQIYCS